MDAIYLLSGLVSLITLIAFFILCNNVAKIKQSVLRPANNSAAWLKQYRKMSFLNRGAEAMNALQEAFYLDTLDINDRNATEEGKDEAYQTLCGKYEPSMKSYNLNIPVRKSNL